MKSGIDHFESQRYKCGECKRTYTPETKEKGYPEETRFLTLRMILEQKKRNLLLTV